MIEYYPSIKVEEPPPPDEEDVIEQTACINGFVNAINNGNFIGVNGARSFLSPSYPASIADITESYLSTMVFIDSPTKQISFVEVFEEFATAYFNTELVEFEFEFIGAACYIGSIILSESRNYFPNIQKVPDPIPPVGTTIPGQTDCITRFVTAVNNGIHDKSQNGALSFLDSRISTYASLTNTYLSEFVFPLSPVYKIEDVKIFPTYATATFRDKEVLINFVLLSGTTYKITSIKIKDTTEYFPTIFTGKIEPTPPPIDTVQLQRICAEGLFNAVDNSQYLAARLYFNPNTRSYRNLYETYIQTRMFAGSPTVKTSNIRVYATYATADFGSQKIYIYYSLLSGAYKVNRFVRMIPSEFYPTMNWSS